MRPRPRPAAALPHGAAALALTLALAVSLRTPQAAALPLSQLPPPPRASSASWRLPRASRDAHVPPASPPPPPVPSSEPFSHAQRGDHAPHNAASVSYEHPLSPVPYANKPPSSPHTPPSEDHHHQPHSGSDAHEAATTPESQGDAGIWSNTGSDEGHDPMEQPGFDEEPSVSDSADDMAESTPDVSHDDGSSDEPLVVPSAEPEAEANSDDSLGESWEDSEEDPLPSPEDMDTDTTLPNTSPATSSPSTAVSATAQEVDQLPGTTAVPIAPVSSAPPAQTRTSVAPENDVSTASAGRGKAANSPRTTRAPSSSEGMLRDAPRDRTLPPASPSQSDKQFLAISVTGVPDGSEKEFADTVAELASDVCEMPVSVSEVQRDPKQSDTLRLVLALSDGKPKEEVQEWVNDDEYAPAVAEKGYPGVQMAVVASPASPESGSGSSDDSEGGGSSLSLGGALGIAAAGVAVIAAAAVMGVWAARAARRRSDCPGDDDDDFTGSDSSGTDALTQDDDCTGMDGAFSVYHPDDGVVLEGFEPDFARPSDAESYRRASDDGLLDPRQQAPEPVLDPICDLGPRFADRERPPPPMYPF